jgi:hypothetical protein
MGCCKRPPKMPSKMGVSRAEIAAHAFECSIASLDGFRAIQGLQSNSRPVTGMRYKILFDLLCQRRSGLSRLTSLPREANMSAAARPLPSRYSTRRQNRDVWSRVHNGR